MIKLLIGVVIGIAVSTTFPNQTQQLSQFLQSQINSGAEKIVEATDQSMVDKLSN
jgi:hypothetical protein